MSIRIWALGDVRLTLQVGNWVQVSERGDAAARGLVFRAGGFHPDPCMNLWNKQPQRLLRFLDNSSPYLTKPSAYAARLHSTCSPILSLQSISQ